MKKEDVINMLEEIERALLTSIEAGTDKVILYKDIIKKDINKKQMKS